MTMGRFSITSLADQRKFSAFLADGAAIVTEGYAGWHVVDRPREVGIVEWQGRNPMAIEIPFLIDYWFDEHDINTPGQKCENQIKTLERLCGIGSHQQPPICTVNADGAIPHDYSINKKNEWVIESVTWDRAVELRRGDNGRRLRAGGTILIRQFITARDILHRLKPGERARKPSFWTVKKGDTLMKIAKKVYGDASKWKIIADANGFRDRRRPLVIGSRLKIPR
jgi:nucleoid-associated protein YgaU